MNASKQHDSFKCPTIAEALCEIHFSVKPETANSNWADTLKKHLGDAYPHLENKEHRQFKAEISPQGVSVNPIGTSIAYHVFKHAKRNHLIQAFPNLLTINEIEKYPGWNVVIKDLETAWTSLQRTISVEKISRIGLRYINKIPRMNPDESVSEWLKPSEFYPSRILIAKAQFASRFETFIDDEHRAIVVLAEGLSQTGEKPIIFDIDVVSEANIEPNWDLVEKTVGFLHDQIWQVFKPALSPKLEKYLNGGGI